MNNKEVKEMIELCKGELGNINNVKKVVGSTSIIMMFMTRYSLIKACGTIELSYKTLISDFCEKSQSQQVKNFISAKVRNNSDNPTLSNINQLLRSFDENWNNKFNELLKLQQDCEKLKSSLNSLNEARNSFAHGGNPNISFENVESYFNDACKIISLLDSVINGTLPKVTN